MTFLTVYSLIKAGELKNFKEGLNFPLYFYFLVDPPLSI